MPIFDKPKAIRILWACAAIAVCGCAPIHGDISRGSFQADRAFEDLERQVRFGLASRGAQGMQKRSNGCKAASWRLAGRWSGSLSSTRASR